MKNSECNLCGKTFRKTWSLKVHIISVHEKLENHKCDFCGKTFTQSEILKIHIKSVHEKQKKITVILKHSRTYQKNLRDILIMFMKF